MARKHRIALVLAAAALALAAGGAFWLTRFASELRHDPGVVYREPETLDKLLRRANDAERAGDLGTAITTYRFVIAVGRGEGARAAELAPYVAAARAGLRRLGAPDTLPGPSR